MKKKKYSCTPTGKQLPFVGVLLCALLIAFAFMDRWDPDSYYRNQAEFVLWQTLMWGSAATVFGLTISAWGRTMRYVEIYPDHIECKALFCKTFVIEYDKCKVGMDYSYIHGGRLWWIYLCYGNYPKYRVGNQYNRINSLRCTDDFIRIQYYDEVYEALIETLPAKKRKLLQTLRNSNIDEDY